MERTKWLKTAILILVLLLLTLSVARFVHLWSLRPVEQTSSEFLDALVALDYDMAFAMSDISFKQQVGSAAVLQRELEAQALNLQRWRITERSREENRAETAGTTRFLDGRSGVFQVRLKQEAGRWLVIGFAVRPDNTE